MTSTMAREGRHATAAAARRAPAALAASRGVIERTGVTLRESSDASLVLGLVVAAGLTGGMLLSRAPRLLVALAFVATLLLGGTLLRRVVTDCWKPSR